MRTSVFAFFPSHDSQLNDFAIVINTDFYQTRNCSPAYHQFRSLSGMYVEGSLRKTKIDIYIFGMVQ